MKEIQKIDPNKFSSGEVDGAEHLLGKLNEVIDVVNMIIITNPRLEESAKQILVLKSQLMSDTPPGEIARND